MAEACAQDSVLEHLSGYKYENMSKQQLGHIFATFFI